MNVQMDRIRSEARARLMGPPWPINVRHANGALTLATTRDQRMRGEEISCEDCDTCLECNEYVE